jgi:dienelactone hydrolase
MERPVEFSSDSSDVLLRGILTAPAGATLGVVFVHGWSGYRCGPHRMFVNAARRFAEAGIASLRFDLRGRGDSGGAFAASDLDGMMQDLLAAARCLRDEAGLDRIVPLGICSGGNVALGAASLDKSFAGLALWSVPLFAPHKRSDDRARRRAFFLVEYAKKALRRETWAKLARGTIDFRGVARTLKGREKVSGRNPKDSVRDVMSDLAGFAGPALFVYGSRDDEAIGAPEFFADWCHDHGVPATFHTVDGANHSYYSVAWEAEVIETTLEWLRSVARDEGAA